MPSFLILISVLYSSVCVNYEQSLYENKHPMLINTPAKILSIRVVHKVYLSFYSPHICASFIN